MSPSRRQLGRYLRGLRRARKLTQEDLAHEASVSADTIRRLESGSVSPTVDTLVRITEALGLSLGVLFMGFETGDPGPGSELEALAQTCSKPEVEAVLRVARVLVRELRRLGDRGSTVVDQHR